MSPQSIPRTHPARRNFNSYQIACGLCHRWFKTAAGRTKHRNSAHLPLSSPTPNHLPATTSSQSDTLSRAVNDQTSGNEDDQGHDAAAENEPNPGSDRDVGGEAAVVSEYIGPTKRLYRNYHTKLDARPCDADGRFLPPGAPPPPIEPKLPSDWTPFRDRTEFETAEFLYQRNQMSASHVDVLLSLWASTLARHGDAPPFADHKDLYDTIDASEVGDIRWQSFEGNYTGVKPSTNPPPWMDTAYDVWFRDPRLSVHNVLSNTNVENELDLRPYREYSVHGDERRWGDFMSGDWAWDQADLIAEDPETIGSMFVPIMLGSDKTMVSVATGNNEYYPLYLSIGNVHNSVRRAHQNAVVLIGFLAMPKTTKEHAANTNFRKFRRQLFHSSVAKILESLKPAMSTPEVVRFGDGHYRRVIYGLGPYIADYEEQVLLACIVRGWCPKCLANRENLDEDALHRCRDYTEALVEEGTLGELWDDFGIVGDLVPFTNDFPRADIHQLIAPDILHQVIKGAFKDHLVDWVEKYIRNQHTKRQADKILDDIDRRIAAVASFSGLRRFPQGRGFKQWTGDDSKALMKVYLPAIEGHVPQDVVRTFRAFLEFCYLVRRNIITETTLNEIQDALQRFHCYREVFKTTGTVLTFSLPRQHSLKHYFHHIKLFAAPNGLCSSITENKHIKAVKEPYRRSNHFNALGQMLVTNQRLDKLAAMRADFLRRGMLHGTCLSGVLECLSKRNNLADDEDVETDDGPKVIEAHLQLAKTPQGKKRAQTVAALAHELGIPHLTTVLRKFLFEQTLPNDLCDLEDVPFYECPLYEGKVSVFQSASSRFYAPSDPSGIAGMRTEHIRACPKWRNEHPRYDCVFVNTDVSEAGEQGMHGLEVARVHCFFSFTFRGVTYPCAVIRWFDKVDDGPDADTGMWVVRPACAATHSPEYAIIHIDSIFRAAHLIPVYGRQFVSQDLRHQDSYNAFQAYYVNKYADHHAFEIAF
ncbi:hypothetical protein BU15DRAFT_88600 [Melanogaster broomeanus]|nr:hypothetical protein BU15DRAFT_88600 [Melanogaster broomeanus]